MRIGPAGGLSHSVLGGKTPVPNGKVMDVKPYSLTQWRRYVVKYGGQDQSGKAIKLFQITSYINDFETLKLL